VAVKLLLDEQISPKVAGRVRTAGVDVASVADLALTSHDDRTIFRAAIDDGRILVTYDIRDYVALYNDFLKEGRRIAGLVVVDVRTIPTNDIHGLANALVKVVAAMAKGEVDPTGGVFLKR
jgi:predicted nuclease of predicted toxin-antitoxin system